MVEYGEENVPKETARFWLKVALVIAVIWLIAEVVY